MGKAALLSSHPERSLVTACGGHGYYDDSMPARFEKIVRKQRLLTVRRNPTGFIGFQILVLRHKRVILDSALAELYQVPVKRLNEQTKRNRKKFPPDFMFQISPRENRSLKSQIATSNIGRGGRRSLPYAFTEHGAIMAATVLNSEQAVEMSVFVVRAFVRLREMLAGNKELSDKIEELEKRLETHDGTIREIINVIKRLMNPPARRRRTIGFELPSARVG
jgi:hypothetical protein